MDEYQLIRKGQELLEAALTNRNAGDPDSSDDSLQELQTILNEQFPDEPVTPPETPTPDGVA